MTNMSRKIAMAKKQVDRKAVDQANDDLDYRLSKTPLERIAAVTFLVCQTLEPFQRMDKTIFTQKNMK